MGQDQRNSAYALVLDASNGAWIRKLAAELTCEGTSF